MESSAHSLGVMARPARGGPRSAGRSRGLPAPRGARLRAPIPGAAPSPGAGPRPARGEVGRASEWRSRSGAGAAMGRLWLWGAWGFWGLLLCAADPRAGNPLGSRGSAGEAQAGAVPAPGGAGPQLRAKGVGGRRLASLDRSTCKAGLREADPGRGRDCSSFIRVAGVSPPTPK